MKKNVAYYVNGERSERQISYIPCRYIISLILAFLETAAVIAVVVILCIFVPYFYIAVILTQLGVVIQIIASDDNPDYKIPWLLFVLILPVVGFMLYFLFAKRKLDKKYVKRLNSLQSMDYPHSDEANFAALKAEAPQACSQAKILCDIAKTHLFTNTEQRYFPCGEDYFSALADDLRSAEKFIFMEYFIIEEGKFWDALLDILKEKAAQGVDVRVVYDDIGCMMTLAGDYAKTLKKLGIKATSFSRLRGNADSEFNNRSHRKITVIDGKVAYTGGINIADEYINAVQKFGHWKDVGIRLEGQAVNELTKLFLTDYGINVKACEPAEVEYFSAADGRADGYVIPFGDGPKPIYDRRVGKTVILNMLNGATDYAYITTPYLITDNELCSAIENAALRGVKVKIVTPHIPDKKLVFAMTRSYYRRLMEAGAEVYEYEPGFIHAKSYLADGKVGMIGTVNLDYRSLVHHFENGVWLYGCDCLKELKADMDATLDKCIKVEPSMLKHNFMYRFFCSLIRIFAPLL